MQKSGQLATIYKSDRGRDAAADAGCKCYASAAGCDADPGRAAMSEPTTSSSSAAGPQGSPPVPRRPTPGSTVGIVDERPTLGGQIYKQFGAGFRVTRRRRARARLPPRPRS